MKNREQYIAVGAVAVAEAYNIFRSFDYYKQFFTSFGLFSGGIYAIQEMFSMLFLLFQLTLIIVFFAADGEYQDKTYKLLRFMFLMSFFLYIPYTLYIYIFKAREVFTNNDTAIMIKHSIGVVISFVCTALFLRARPRSQPEKIDLANYELVNYTSTGHRFVHRLIDALFILPIFFFWGRILDVNNQYVLQLVFVLVYLVYCFVAELLFRQTLGKIATNSCVTTIGTEYSAGRILVRTLARLIPFDAFSFLFKRNWHDTTSDTSVVYVNSWEKAFDESNMTDTAAVAK
ncbi:MAG: RDD family protein [Niastella sp.]|nr:RDD family protein [Niastella sp.]